MSEISPYDEVDYQWQIKNKAESLQTQYGWTKGSTPGRSNPRIAANKPAENKLADGQHYWRQGGSSLAKIFETAGAHVPSDKCLKISAKAYTMYHSAGQPSNWRNIHDIPSWCGIFALSVYKSCGFNVAPWKISATGGGLRSPDMSGYNEENSDFLVLPKNKDPEIGDIGLDNASGNMHHFLVVGISENQLETVEGNVTFQSDTPGYQTIVRRRKYSITGMRSNAACKFYRPNWSKIAG